MNKRSIRKVQSNGFSCELKGPGTLASEVRDLSASVRKKISPGTQGKVQVTADLSLTLPYVISVLMLQVAKSWFEFPSLVFFITYYVKESFLAWLLFVHHWYISTLSFIFPIKTLILEYASRSFVITLSHSVREVCFKNLILHSDKRGPITAVTWFLFEFWCFLLSTFVSHHLNFVLRMLIRNMPPDAVWLQTEDR